jgi:purine-binding chemotaxis protein CheW
MGEVLTFLVGEEEFGVGIGTAVEVLRPRRAREVPDMPDYISGFITVRKDVLPLVDLKKRFGVQSAERKERVLVVRYASEKVALLVDGVPGILKYDDSRLKKPPAVFRGLKAKYISGLLETNGKAIILLDVASVLTSKEKIALKQALNRLKKGTQS